MKTHSLYYCSFCFYILFFLFTSTISVSCQETNLVKVSKIKTFQTHENILQSFFQYQKNNTMKVFATTNSPLTNIKAMKKFYDYLVIKNELQSFYISEFPHDEQIKKFYDLEKLDDFDLQMYSIKINYISVNHHGSLSKLVYDCKQLSQKIDNRKKTILEYIIE